MQESLLTLLQPIWLFFIGINLLWLLQSTENPPSDGNVCPKGIILNTARLLFRKKRHTHTHSLMKYLDFPDVIPAEAQQGPIPRQSLVMRLQEPCASQPDHKFTAAPLGLGFSWMLSRYERILHRDEEDGHP